MMMTWGPKIMHNRVPVNFRRAPAAGAKTPRNHKYLGRAASATAKMHKHAHIHKPTRQLGPAAEVNDPRPKVNQNNPNAKVFN